MSGLVWRRWGLFGRGGHRVTPGALHVVLVLCKAQECPAQVVQIDLVSTVRFDSDQALRERSAALAGDAMRA
jgi:hypothetical protein